MENTTIFLDAVLNKIRFDTGRGQFTTEDLLDLDLQTLNKIAIAVNAKLSPTETVSFLEEPSTATSKANEQNQLRLDILKFVIKLKQDKAKAAKAAASTTAQVRLLESLLEQKRLNNLANLDEDQLLAQIASLKGEAPAAAAPAPATAGV